MKATIPKKGVAVFSNLEIEKQAHRQATLIALSKEKSKNNITQDQKIDIVLAQQQLIAEQQEYIIELLIKRQPK